jgi:hypothetical protein
MDRPLPKLTRYPCNSRTRQGFSFGLRTRTIFEACGDRELDSALFPQTASRSEVSSPGASRNAATPSRVTRRPAINARRSTGVVNA